jgi:hypothetical protein
MEFDTVTRIRKHGNQINIFLSVFHFSVGMKLIAQFKDK